MIFPIAALRLHGGCLERRWHETEARLSTHFRRSLQKILEAAGEALLELGQPWDQLQLAAVSLVLFVLLLGLVVMQGVLESLTRAYIFMQVRKAEGPPLHELTSHHS